MWFKLKLFTLLLESGIFPVFQIAFQNLPSCRIWEKKSFNLKTIADNSFSLYVTFKLIVGFKCYSKLNWQFFTYCIVYPKKILFNEWLTSEEAIKISRERSEFVLYPVFYVPSSSAFDAKIFMQVTLTNMHYWKNRPDFFSRWFEC